MASLTCYFERIIYTAKVHENPVENRQKSLFSTPVENRHSRKIYRKQFQESGVGVFLGVRRFDIQGVERFISPTPKPFHPPPNLIFPPRDKFSILFFSIYHTPSIISSWLLFLELRFLPSFINSSMIIYSDPFVWWILFKCG